MDKPTTYLAAIVDIFFISFGLWTIYCHFFTFSGFTFNELMQWSIIPAVLCWLLMMYRTKPAVWQTTAPSAEPPANGKQRPWPWLLIGPAVIVGIYYITGNFVLWWLLSVTFVALLAFSAPIYLRQVSPSERYKHSPELCRWLLPAVIITVLILSLFKQSGNWEAPFYLSMGVYSAEFPDQALLAADWLHGEPSLPPLAVFYMVHSYELLVAVISQLVGIEQITLYFEILPRAFMVLAVIVHWLALRQLGLCYQAAMFGILLTVLVWVSWGGPPRTLGRWSLNTLMAGKGIMVMVVIPAVFYYAARFRERGDFFSWASFSCAQIAAVGLSSSGIVAAPLTAAIILLSGSGRTKKALIKTAWGFVPTLYIAVVAVILMLEINSFGLVSTNRSAVGTPEQGLLMVLGQDGLRPYLALFCLLAITIIPMTRPVSHKRLQYLVLAILLLVVNPYSALLLNKLAGNMWWRTFWSVPFALLIGIAGANFATTRLRSGRVPINLLGYCTLALAFVFASHQWAISKTRIQAPWDGGRPPYINRHYDAAKAVVKQSDREDLILGPTRVMMWLIAFKNHPRLVAVRQSYVSIFAVMGEEEPARRALLLRLMDGRLWKREPAQASKALRLLREEVARLQISGVVLDDNFSLHQSFKDLLKDIGFEQQFSIDGYTFWKR